MIPLIGYALFRGDYGEFTIPVLNIEDFTIPSGLTGNLLSIGPDTFNAIPWNFSKDIWSLVPNPPKNTPTSHEKVSPFVCEANPSMELSVCWQTAKISGATFPDNYYERIDTWRNGSLADFGSFGRNPNTSVPAIFKLPDEGNKYFLTFSYDEPASNLPDGVATRFLFTDGMESFGFDSVTLQSSPVLLSPTMPEFYLSSPDEPIYVKRGEPIELEFSLKGIGGTTIKNAPFTYKNTQPDATGITNWSIHGNTLTFTNECWYAMAWIRFNSADYPELECEVEFHITDPMPQPNLPGPYLPDSGGISGGGNGSTGSNTVTGTFDAQPGPSIVEKLPVGSSGADIASSGMYTKYLCNNALLNLLAEFFWEDNVGIQVLKAVLGNPIDSIISLTAYPFALETLVPTTATTVYFGQYDSNFSAFSLTKSSFQIDWGTVTIPFFWGSFLDYSPYTKIQLYLPWGVGFVSIDPDEVMPWSRKNSFNQTDFTNGTIRVLTNIELDKGSCVHNVIGNNGRVIGSFGGIVGKQIPVSGADNSARTLALIGAAAMIGTSVASSAISAGNLTTGMYVGKEMISTNPELIPSGNFGSGFAAGSILGTAAAVAKATPTYPRAGTFSDATSTLGYQYPYLIISRPSQSVPKEYGRFMGYPSNIFHNHLGEVRGYTEISNIHLDDIPATSNELDELESILKGGVLL